MRPRRENIARGGAPQAAAVVKISAGLSSFQPFMIKSLTPLCGQGRKGWLIVAGILHLFVALGIFLAGHFQLVPSIFDRNGIGLTFAIDGATYRQLASDMAGHWQANGLSAWLEMKAPFHCRLYSLMFALFGRVLGQNILAAEPLNLFYYLGILTFVYLLGREIFNPRAGLLAATIVGAWPSFLLHSTQPIRDPLSIFCLLGLLYVLTLLLSRGLSLRQGFGIGLGGASLATVFWVARGNMWNVVIVAVAITVILLSYRMIREGKFIAGNVLVILLLAATLLLVPSRLESTTLLGVRPPVTPLAIPSASQPPAHDGIWTRAINQIGERRAGFRFYSAQASNIDSDARLIGAKGVLRFIPRAAVIGFFAPFPRMWVQPGSFGVAGRLISGLETLAMYFLYIAVAVCLWRERQRLKMWLTFMVATAGLVGLGLVVVNAGALYRIRYVFWMMLIVIAAEGLVGIAKCENAKLRNCALSGGVR